MSSDNTDRIIRDLEDFLNKWEAPDACTFESMELFEHPDPRDIDSEWEPSKWQQSQDEESGQKSSEADL
jgi:hypothetical protein